MLRDADYRTLLTQQCRNRRYPTVHPCREVVEEFDREEGEGFVGHVEREWPHLYQNGSRPGSIAEPFSTARSTRSRWRTARSAMIWHPKELPRNAARSRPASCIQAANVSESSTKLRT